jgi:hypothetical protein
MISGGGGIIFSIADLNGTSASLYAKIKIKGKVVECVSSTMGMELPMLD